MLNKMNKLLFMCSCCDFTTLDSVVEFHINTGLSLHDLELQIYVLD